MKKFIILASLGIAVFSLAPYHTVAVPMSPTQALKALNFDEPLVGGGNSATARSYFTSSSSSSHYYCSTSAEPRSGAAAPSAGAPSAAGSYDWGS